MTKTERAKYNRERREANKQLGLCKCGLDRLNGFRMCERCVQQERGRTKRRAEHRRANGLCILCGKPADKPKCEKCRKIAVRFTRKLKADVIDAYGGKCACCGEGNPAFMTIDHIFNDGSQHRKSVNSKRIYGWLKKNGYPKDRYQLLCFNCNFAKRFNGGVCPHKVHALK